MLSAETFSTEEAPPSIVTLTVSLNEKESDSGLSTENAVSSVNEIVSARLLSKNKFGLNSASKSRLRP